jgi:ATP:ADP antiporter, AAA family
MKPTSTLLRILNVRSNEWKLVRTLFIFEFFQGAGIAFFFTSAFALFLDKFHISELPKVLIYSSFLLWIVGYIYSKLEAKMNIITLAKSMTLFIALSFLLFRFSVDAMPPAFLYLMLAWFNVLYLLNNLEFWGITSLLFDVRQSKRLFGLISAGDIPAKFIGYTLALVLVSYIGTANLLWVGFVCILASLPCLYSIERSGLLNRHHHHKDVKHAAHQVSHLVKNFSANALIRRIAIITLIASAAFIIVNFSFYAKVKEAIHSDIALAQFIAFFFATVRVVALFVKTILTGRLINRLGIIKALLITPVLMILLVFSIIISDSSVSPQSFSLYLFGAMAIFVDILRTTINTPVFLTLMQPLSTHERLRAHTITKGIMDPFASLLTGILLLVVLRFEHDTHLSGLNYILLALGVFWIIGIYRIHQQYLKTLLKTIGNRFFNNTEFSINDSSTLHWIKYKLSSGNETEASNILKMFAAHPTMFDNEIVLSALEHPSVKIKTQAVQLAEQKSIVESEDQLRKILESSSEPVLRAESIKALSKIHIREEEILPFINNANAAIQKAAITGILEYGNEESKREAKAYLALMVSSENVDKRRKAAFILQDLQDVSYKNEVLQLIEDTDKEVMQAAFIASGKMQDEELLTIVLSRLTTNEKVAIEALFLAGESSLSLLKSFILSRRCTHQQTERLIRLIGRIGGRKAHNVLLHLMDELPGYPHIIIKTFYQSNYTGNAEQRLFFEEQVRNCLGYCASMLYMQRLLTPYQPKYQLLINSLELELVNLRDTLLYIFALLYDKEKIKDVRSAFKSGNKEAIANAMEIIEMTVRKDAAYHFNLIFESADIEHKTHALRKLYPSSFFSTIENILVCILSTEDFKYNYWTKACSIYTSKKQHHIINTNLISRYAEAEHPLLSELAKYAV